MSEAKISQKYQIVIPKEARSRMQVGAGDRLIVETIHGVTVLIPKPKSMSRYLRGLDRGLYSKDYLAGERKSWRK